MCLLKVMAIAVGLGMDAMSVCMAVGVRWHGPRQRLRLSWNMGLMQFAMPLIGWAAGSRLAGLLSGVGRYVAAALVVGVGVKMLHEAVRSHPGAAAEEAEHFVEEHVHLTSRDPTRGWSLLLLSTATSIDALVVGFSLGLRGEAIWLASVLIGVTAAVMALAGVALGKKLGAALGKRAELAGAGLLIALGLAMPWM